MPRPLSLLAAALIALAHPAAADQSIQTETLASLTWDVTPEGVAFAPLYGERFSEPYMAMVRLPAGLVSPAHVKSANMFGVMVQGSMIHHAMGADPATQTVLEEGSFYRIPADMPHVSRCVSDVECITFLYQDGQFDFVPVAE